MKGRKISGLPLIDPFNSIEEYCAYKEAAGEPLHGDGDLYMMIKILQNQNKKLNERIDQIEKDVLK